MAQYFFKDLRIQSQMLGLAFAVFFNRADTNVVPLTQTTYPLSTAAFSASLGRELTEGSNTCPLCLRGLVESAQAEMDEELHKAGLLKRGTTPVIDIRGRILIGFDKRGIKRPIQEATRGEMLRRQTSRGDQFDHG